jgi:hypothetical protein
MKTPAGPPIVLPTFTDFAQPPDNADIMPFDEPITGFISLSHNTPFFSSISLPSP